jgi:hypothetical protein
LHTRRAKQAPHGTRRFILPQPSNKILWLRARQRESDRLLHGRLASKFDLVQLAFFLMELGQQTLAKQAYGIAQRALFVFFLEPIVAGIAARMAFEAVGLALEQSRALVRARSRHGG